MEIKLCKNCKWYSSVFLFGDFCKNPNCLSNRDTDYAKGYHRYSEPAYARLCFCGENDPKYYEPKREREKY